MDLRGASKFFEFCRERHAIYLRRAAGLPREEWTSDPILRRYRFTNVFRELDKTTVWFRENVRDRLRDSPDVMLATVVFRMLNRIEAGEAVFRQTTVTDAGDVHTAFEKFLVDGGTGHMRWALKNYLKSGPYVTGAYIISTPPGHKKLDGVLKIVEGFAGRRCEVPGCDKTKWRCAVDELIARPREVTLERTWEWLRQFPYLGTFHSYEIVTDLRHTTLLEHASDVDTWASVGPGARRGLNRIAGRRREVDGRKGWGGKIGTEQALEEMRELLTLSRDCQYWPQQEKPGAVVQIGGYPEDSVMIPGYKVTWPRWELREVEHSLCEFDKYCRVVSGEGRPRGVFR